MTVKDAPEPEPHITMRVKTFCEATGLCRTKVYELIGDGELESVRIGKLRLVIVDSYRRFLDRRKAS